MERNLSIRLTGNPRQVKVDRPSHRQTWAGRYNRGMRTVLQRVSRARVVVADEVVGAIERGLLALVAVAPDDTPAQAEYLADKVAGLRLFADADDKMNLSVTEVRGGVLAVSQFTLYGDCRKGRRPSFLGAAAPEKAIPLYEAFVNALRAVGCPRQRAALGP